MEYQLPPKLLDSIFEEVSKHKKEDVFHELIRAVYPNVSQVQLIKRGYKEMNLFTFHHHPDKIAKYEK